MRARLSLAVAVLLVATTACGGAQRLVGGEQICTDIGCESEVSVTLGGRGLAGKAGAVTATMCFDGTCETSRVRLKASGETLGKPSPLMLDPAGPDVEAALRLPSREYDDSRAHDVTLEVRVNEDEPVVIEREVTLERSQPNGAGCEPICWQATIEA